MSKKTKVTKGFKAFNKDLKCRGEQFEVGQTYTVKGPLELCANGYHFCVNAFDVYNYYPKAGDTRICEVEAYGPVKTEGDKSCARKLTIVRELSAEERLELWIKRSNSGDYNSGDYNSGDHNSGDYNSGYHNSGYRNSGYYNSGYYNSGYRNSGDYNSGNHNSGDYNSGYHNSGNHNSGNHNSGNHNSGYYNSGYHNSGFFNTNSPTVRLFNKDSGLAFDSNEAQRLRNLPVKPILEWVYSDEMSDKEKKENPSHKTTGGFLRNTGRTSWKALTKEHLDFIQSLPNFDAGIFEEISGLKLGKKGKKK